MNDVVTLKGITWDHSRAFPPLVATAQRYEEMHPHTRIVWEKRSLHAFGHADVAELATQFDLLVIDHPCVGYAAQCNALLPLQHCLPAAFRKDLMCYSAGSSYDSYVWDEQLLALPIDAATPVASYRADLFERHGLALPQTWAEVVALAKRGLVLMPGFHVDCLLNFIGMCVTLGGDVFRDDTFVGQAVGEEALAMLAELACELPPLAWESNPVAVHETMSSSDDYAYCPFAYNYSNYSRPGFAPHRLTFTSPVRLGAAAMQTVLGGTGLAISRRCAHADQAIDYAMYTAGDDIQRTIYAAAGGQPSHLAAWNEDAVNAQCGDFFRNTLASMQSAYVRPRFAGFLHFQENAGRPLVQYLRHGGDRHAVLEAMATLYRAARHTGCASTADAGAN